MQKEQLIKTIESFAPLELMEEWDNSGVQIDMGYPDCKRVLTALEINDDVISEAMDKGEPLRIWYSENPKELCGLCYLCSLLKHSFIKL